MSPEPVTRCTKRGLCILACSRSKCDGRPPDRIRRLATEPQAVGDSTNVPRLLGHEHILAAGDVKSGSLDLLRRELEAVNAGSEPPRETLHPRGMSSIAWAPSATPSWQSNPRGFGRPSIANQAWEGSLRAGGACPSRCQSSAITRSVRHDAARPVACRRCRLRTRYKVALAESVPVGSRSEPPEGQRP
jgi:hypothetical protein